MTPTQGEISAFLQGMRHAEKLATATKKGHLAAAAIRKEVVTLSLYREVHFPVAKAEKTDHSIDT